MKWWYMEDGNVCNETYDCFEHLSFSICSLRKNHLYEHDVNNIYIFNDDGLYLIVKASEIDPLSIHAHMWNDEQINRAYSYEFSRIEEDRMLYLTRVMYEKEWKSEEEIMEIETKLNDIENYSSEGFQNEMFLKEYKCCFDAGRNVVIKFNTLRKIKQRNFISHRVISKLMRTDFGLQYEMEENAYVLAFDSAMKGIGILHLSCGNDSECEIDTRIIFRFLLLVGATQFVVVHNHPNGNDELTQNDYEITRQIDIAAQIFNIKFLEHIVICNDKDIYGLAITKEMLDKDIEDVSRYYV